MEPWWSCQKIRQSKLTGNINNETSSKMVGDPLNLITIIMRGSLDRKFHLENDMLMRSKHSISNWKPMVPMQTIFIYYTLGQDSLFCSLMKCWSKCDFLQFEIKKSGFFKAGPIVFLIFQACAMLSYVIVTLEFEPLWNEFGGAWNMRCVCFGWSRTRWFLLFL